MKTANTFYWSFIDTLILNVATIAAIVVALVQFAVRAFKENNGPEKTRKVMQTVLRLIDNGVAYFLALVADPVTVPQVSTKRTKRA
jgi:hypothetical protein